MIIKLNGADFSANNIGHVEVTTVLGEFTKKAIIASGNESMNDVQKSALDSFFRLIGAGKTGNTIASKLRFLFLPMLAQDVSNALINYKDESFEKAATPLSSAWKMEDGGIAGKDATATGSIVIPLTNPLVATDVCMLSMTARPTDGTSGNQHYLSIRGKQNNTKWLTFYRSGSSYGSQPNQWMQVKSGNGQVWGYNLRTDGAYTICKSGLRLSTAPALDLSDQSSEDIYTLGLSSKNLTPTAMMMLGNSLSDEELQAVIEAMDNLYTIFGLE